MIADINNLEPELGPAETDRQPLCWRVRAKLAELIVKAKRRLMELTGFVSAHDPEEDLENQARLMQMRHHMKQKWVEQPRISFGNTITINKAMAGRRTES